MTDILLNDDFTFRHRQGDFVTGESTKQHQKALILASKGELRQFPFIGVGLANYLNDDAFGDIKGAIQQEFERDGMTVESISVFEDGTLSTKAVY